MSPLASTRPPRLVGDLAVWLVIGAEMLAFAILFLSYAVARSLDVATFNASQATLELTSGAINTALLLTGSWCVARGVQAARTPDRATSLRWLVATLVCGGGFVTLKCLEFAHKFDQGLDLSTNTFYMFYFLLTGFHFLHVVVAMVFLAFVGVVLAREPGASIHLGTLESAAAFWHMVDLLWIVLFPLVYVMR